MMYEQHEQSPHEDELHDKFIACMNNNVTARYGYDAAKSFGMTEEFRLKAAIINLVELNNRLQTDNKPEFTSATAITTRKIIVHDGVSVADLIERLQSLDPRHEFLVQAILPDGTAWCAPAIIGEIPLSNCGDGVPYLYLQIRCDGGGVQ